MDVVIYLV